MSVKINRLKVLSNDQSVGNQCESLTDFDVQNVVRADSLATVLIELFDVYGNRQALKFLASLGELAHPLGSSGLRMTACHCMRGGCLILFGFWVKFP